VVYISFNTPRGFPLTVLFDPPSVFELDRNEYNSFNKAQKLIFKIVFQSLNSVQYLVELAHYFLFNVPFRRLRMFILFNFVVPYGILYIGKDYNKMFPIKLIYCCCLYHIGKY
jgi:hypothetical protein